MMRKLMDWIPQLPDNFWHSLWRRLLHETEGRLDSTHMCVVKNGRSKQGKALIYIDLLYLGF